MSSVIYSISFPDAQSADQSEEQGGSLRAEGGQSEEDVSLWKVSSRGVMFSRERSVEAMLRITSTYFTIINDIVVARFSSAPV